MAGLKQIMYGVTDFARMRAENAYFVDRTDLIRELEKTSYTVFHCRRRHARAAGRFLPGTGDRQGRQLRRVSLLHGATHDRGLFDGRDRIQNSKPHDRSVYARLRAEGL